MRLEVNLPGFITLVALRIKVRPFFMALKEIDENMLEYTDQIHVWIADVQVSYEIDRGPRSVCDRAGGPGLRIWNWLTWKPDGGYHFNTSRGSREVEGAPGSGVWYLGLGVAVSFPGVRNAGGAQTLLWPGSSSLHYVQLLPAAASFANRTGAGRLRERAFEDSR